MQVNPVRVNQGLLTGTGQPGLRGWHVFGQRRGKQGNRYCRQQGRSGSGGSRRRGRLCRQRGLLRYGDLLIIKHNDSFLSAYAHNSALLVTEGDRVRQGEQIAELGSTGIDREMLHFEIRLEGKPADPMGYLRRPGPKFFRHYGF